LETHFTTGRPALAFTVVCVDDEGAEHHDGETLEELCGHLHAGAECDEETFEVHVGDDDDEWEEKEDSVVEKDDCDSASLADQSSRCDSSITEIPQDTEEDLEEGVLGNEFMMQSTIGGGPAAQGIAHPQVGTTGFVGNAQNKPHFKLEVNNDQSGARVIPISTTRCTPTAQMCMPFAKFFPNKVLNIKFFKSIWKLTFLCLQCFSPLHSAIFSRFCATTKKGHPDPVSALMISLKQLVQCLQDCVINLSCLKIRFIQDGRLRLLST
jgi:hypothetical protein